MDRVQPGQPGAVRSRGHRLPGKDGQRAGGALPVSPGGPPDLHHHRRPCLVSRPALPEPRGHSPARWKEQGLRRDQGAPVPSRRIPEGARGLRAGHHRAGGHGGRPQGFRGAVPRPGGEGGRGDPHRRPGGTDHLLQPEGPGTVRPDGGGGPGDADPRLRPPRGPGARLGQPPGPPLREGIHGKLRVPGDPPGRPGAPPHRGRHAAGGGRHARGHPLLHPGRHPGAAPPRTAPPGPEAGGGGPARGRDRSRLQQRARRHPFLRGAAGAPDGSRGNRRP